MFTTRKASRVSPYRADQPNVTDSVVVRAKVLSSASTDRPTTGAAFQNAAKASSPLPDRFVVTKIDDSFAFAVVSSVGTKKERNRVWTSLTPTVESRKISVLTAAFLFYAFIDRAKNTFIVESRSTFITSKSYSSVYQITIYLFYALKLVV